MSASSDSLLQQLLENGNTLRMRIIQLILMGFNYARRASKMFPLLLEIRSAKGTSLIGTNQILLDSCKIEVFFEKIVMKTWFKMCTVLQDINSLS